MTEVGSGEGASTVEGAQTTGEPWLDSFLFSLWRGDDLVPPGAFAGPADELTDPDLEFGFS